MMIHIKSILENEKLMPFALAMISAAALGAAFISQYAFGLEPCVLCIYQRVPFAIVVALGLLGFILSYKCKRTTAAVIALSGLTLLINSIIAFYHTGVEQHWWRSFLEGCAVPEMEGNITDVLAKIQATTDVVRCDEIPWQDPIIGLSMANYNVILCLGLAIIAAVSATMILRKSKSA